MSDEQATQSTDGASSATLQANGLTDEEARLYSYVAVARLEESALTLEEPEQLALLMRALEDLDALRRAGIGVPLERAVTPDDVGHLGLDDAVEATRLALIAQAVGADLLTPAGADTLDALTAALERLERLEAASSPEANPRVAVLELLAERVGYLLNRVDEARITREHLTGRLEALRDPLEVLDATLARLKP